MLNTKIFRKINEWMNLVNIFTFFIIFHSLIRASKMIITFTSKSKTHFYYRKGYEIVNNSYEESVLSLNFIITDISTE